MLDLQPIKARRDKATPGPWNRNKWLNFSAATTGDCEFIANAPTDIAALIAEVERVRAENAELKEKEKRLIDVAMSEVNFWSKADIEAIDPQEALDYWVEVLKEAQS